VRTARQNNLRSPVLRAIVSSAWILPSPPLPSTTILTRHEMHLDDLHWGSRPEDRPNCRNR
jgi:hypothetical protein